MTEQLAEARIEFPYYLESDEQWQAFKDRCAERYAEARERLSIGPEAYDEDSRYISEETDREIVQNAAMMQLADGSPVYYVNVHEIDRAYGGGEEGGWWYDCGTAIVSAVVRDLTEARAAFMRLAEEYADEPGADVGSVVYRGGCYRVSLDDRPAADYPDRRPHYC